MNALSWARSSCVSAPQARRISRTFGVSRIASSRCSTVMNSWRASRALWNASFRQYSSSLLSTSDLFHGAQQRVLMLSRVSRHLGHLGFRNFKREYAAHSFAPSMHFEHDARRRRAVHAKDALEDVDHEFHRREVVVQQHHLEERR